MNYKSSKEIREALNITAQTLKVWKDIGKIKFIKLSDKKYLYDLNPILSCDSLNKRKNVIYARVSNTKQINDLITQTQIIAQYMGNNGLNMMGFMRI